jgi:hypothetical protein
MANQNTGSLVFEYIEVVTVDSSKGLRSGNAKYKNVPEQKLAYIAKTRMKRQPTMSASEQADSK